MKLMACGCWNNTVFKIQKQDDLFGSVKFIKWNGEDRGQEFTHCPDCGKNLSKEYDRREEIKRKVEL